MLLAAPLAAADRPNFVFVLVDDLRYDGLGCTGHPLVKTPNVDRLAREGVIFKNAFVSIPLCSPSRSGFLTGCYAHRMLTEYFKEQNFPRTPAWQSVRTERWKYIHYPENPAWDELYDLRADPHELKSRVKDESATGELKELRAELDKLLRETGAK
jgi:arylsulfatase A-like enzyme